MRLIILAAVAALAGCSAPPELTGNAEGGVVTYGTRRMDEMAHGRGANAGFGLAEAHCSRFGRTAQVMNVDDRGGALTFACVRS